jgi:hypothetical protein
MATTAKSTLVKTRSSSSVKSKRLSAASSTSQLSPTIYESAVYFSGRYCLLKASVALGKATNQQAALNLSVYMFSSGKESSLTVPIAKLKPFLSKIQPNSPDITTQTVQYLIPNISVDTAQNIKLNLINPVLAPPQIAPIAPNSMKNKPKLLQSRSSSNKQASSVKQHTLSQPKQALETKITEKGKLEPKQAKKTLTSTSTKPKKLLNTNSAKIINSVYAAATANTAANSTKASTTNGEKQSAPRAAANKSKRVVGAPGQYKTPTKTLRSAAIKPIPIASLKKKLAESSATKGPTHGRKATLYKSPGSKRTAKSPRGAKSPQTADNSLKGLFSGLINSPETQNHALCKELANLNKKALDLDRIIALNGQLYGGDFACSGAAANCPLILLFSLQKHNAIAILEHYLAQNPSEEAKIWALRALHRLISLLGSSKPCICSGNIVNLVENSPLGDFAAVIQQFLAQNSAEISERFINSVLELLVGVAPWPIPVEHKEISLMKKAIVDKSLISPVFLLVTRSSEATQTQILKNIVLLLQNPANSSLFHEISEFQGLFWPILLRNGPNSDVSKLVLAILTSLQYDWLVVQREASETHDKKVQISPENHILTQTLHSLTKFTWNFYNSGDNAANLANSPRISQLNHSNSVVLSFFHKIKTRSRDLTQNFNLNRTAAYDLLFLTARIAEEFLFTIGNNENNGQNGPLSPLQTPTNANNPANIGNISDSSLETYLKLLEKQGNALVLPPAQLVLLKNCFNMSNSLSSAIFDTFSSCGFKLDNDFADSTAYSNAEKVVLQRGADELRYFRLLNDISKQTLQFFEGNSEENQSSGAGAGGSSPAERQEAAKKFKKSVEKLLETRRSHHKNYMRLVSGNGAAGNNAGLATIIKSISLWLRTE